MFFVLLGTQTTVDLSVPFYRLPVSVESTALPDHRGQLVANLKNAGSIVLIYDVERMETLARLNSVWLPLIETHTKVWIGTVHEAFRLFDQWDVASTAL